MKHTYIILAIVLFFGACTSNTIYKKPKDLIPKDQMVDLMVDMYMANVSVNLPNKDNLRNIQYFPLVYKKHKIDSTRFKNSNLYYMSKIKDYLDINQRVIDKLEILKKAKEAVRKIEDSILKIKSDSIQKIKSDSVKKFKEAKLKIKLKDSLKSDFIIGNGVIIKKPPLKTKKKIQVSNKPKSQRSIGYICLPKNTSYRFASKRARFFANADLIITNLVA